MQWFIMISVGEHSWCLTALMEPIRIINPWSIKVRVRFEINVWSLYDPISTGYMRSSNLRPAFLQLVHDLKTGLTLAVDYDVSVWKWDRRLGFSVGLQPRSNVRTLLTSTLSIAVAPVITLHSSALPIAVASMAYLPVTSDNYVYAPPLFSSYRFFLGIYYMWYFRYGSSDVFFFSPLISLLLLVLLITLTLGHMW